MKLLFYQQLRRNYRGLAISTAFLYAMTLLPMDYVFTNFTESYWYYYLFVSLLAILSSYLFFGPLRDAAQESGSLISLVSQYEALSLFLALVFITLPLQASLLIRSANESILSQMLLEQGSESLSYAGPVRLLSLLLYLIFANSSIILAYFRYIFSHKAG